MICSSCGNHVPPDSPAGQCPSCLLGIAVAPPPVAEPATRSPAKERRFGDYMLGTQLGSGGMGIVYEALQLSLNRKVALKFIRDSQLASPTQLRRFTIEAEATARLDHPGIVGIHEISELDGQPYYSMDLVEGESLRTAIAKGRFVLRPQDGTKTSVRDRQAEIARLMARTARAVHHAHQRGVLHRDLKPANVIIDQNDYPRLTDFGLAKIIRQATDQSTQPSLTGSADIAGTPSYMSPEQASSTDISQASDIYGLGAMFYELLTGQPPFKAATPLETLKQLQEEQATRPRSMNRLVDRDLETICMKCLEKHPRHRYFSAEALAEDLDNWIERKPIKGRPPGPAVRLTHWIRRNRAGAGFIGTLLIALVIMLALLKVNYTQKVLAQKQQAISFQDKADRINSDWEDTNRANVILTANDLAILDGRLPTDNRSAPTLMFGARANISPISLAQHTYAPLFGQIQAEIARSLNQDVEISLNLFKPGQSEVELLLSTNTNVDIMIVDATSFLLAHQRDPRLRAIAQLTKVNQGAIAALQDSDLKQLQDLRGHSLAFPDETSPLTIWAKASLFDAGVLKAQLRSSESWAANAAEAPLLAPHQLRLAAHITVTAVLQKKVEAGVTLLRRYEYDSYQGLTLLHSFPTSPRVIVARPGLDQKVTEAFRDALVTLTRRKMKRSSNMSSWEEEFPGAVPVNDADFSALREAMRKAARFDGLSDAFTPVPAP